MPTSRNRTLLTTTMPWLVEMRSWEQRASGALRSSEEWAPRVKESYDLQQMEFKSQDFTLHQTGSLKKSAEFKTADNFTGYYLIDAKQSIPGQKSLKELEEYFGSFEINRRILFRNDAKSKATMPGSRLL